MGSIAFIITLPRRTETNRSKTQSPWPEDRLDDPYERQEGKGEKEESSLQQGGLGLKGDREKRRSHFVEGIKLGLQVRLGVHSMDGFSSGAAGDKVQGRG